MVVLVGDGTKIHRPGCPAIGPSRYPSAWARKRTLDEVISESIANKDLLKPCLRCLTIEPLPTARPPKVGRINCRNSMCKKSIARAAASPIVQGFCPACRKAFHDGYNKGYPEGEAKGKRDGAREAEERMRKGG